ncbi:MAG: AAA family ATPase [Thermoguttaceae bacterium]|jgi:predicted ATPase|nr:AAA family ATPase [Thermoguttaceae bacterium]
MISLLEVLRYRCLRYIRQPLGRFEVLVGPNASGKTTFLDAIAFLSDLVDEGLEAAVGNRTQNFSDLVWDHADEGFEIAVEAPIPEDQWALLADEYRRFDTLRYELGIGRDPQTGETIIVSENGCLAVRGKSAPAQTHRVLFPEPDAPPPATIIKRRSGGSKALFTKIPGGNDNFYAEAYAKAGRWAPAFKLGQRKSTLGNLPEDESKFPVSSWFKRLLAEGVEKITLNSQAMRRPSPPGQKVGFKPDGSNLPWVVERLRSAGGERFQEWLEHVRTALPDLRDVRTVQRPEDNHRYLVLVYDGGLEVPSWTASDGTLRLLALTLPAYLDDFRGIYLIEEPENGVHPRAVETVYQSLSSVYEGQILVATHSPVILSIVDPKDVLCFAKTTEGATDIVRGSEHPRLRDWRHEENFGVLFAAGVLG